MEREFRVQGTENGFHDLFHTGVQGLTLADLRRLRVPRIVVWGQHDTVDDLKAGRTSAQALGVKLIVIPRAGHLSMLDEPRRSRRRSGRSRPGSNGRRRAVENALARESRT